MGLIFNISNVFIVDYAAVFINACCLLIAFVLDVRRPWVTNVIGLMTETRRKTKG